MTSLSLTASLDTAAAVPLHRALVERLEAAQPMLLDGSAVTRVGQACLQLLVSARDAARERGIPFAIAHPSAALTDMAALVGLGTALEPIG